MAAELPREGRPESKAATALRDAGRSLCPHCGRETKTVSGGVCADCWGVKDPERAVVFRPEPKTESLLGGDGLFGWLEELSWAAVLAGGVVLVGIVAVVLGLVL